MEDNVDDIVVDDIESTVINNLGYTYGSNDICLTIYPYDNYKKIALYERDVDGIDREYNIDRSEIYKYSLEFGDGSKTSKKRVTIKECKDYYSSTGEYVKLNSNELLFKITQKEAYQILALTSNEFNVVREVVINDDVYQNTTSEIQSIFSGRWATLQDKKSTNDSLLIQQLTDKIKDLLNTNDELNSRILELLKEIGDLVKENERLSVFEKYKDMYDELLNQNDMANEYTGTAIEHDAKYITVNIDEREIENKVNEALESLQDIKQD